MTPFILTYFAVASLIFAGLVYGRASNHVLSTAGWAFASVTVVMLGAVAIGQAVSDYMKTMLPGFVG